MDDLSKYLSLFVSEATEHIDALAREVGNLSEEGVLASRPGLIDELFRHAHSVKGMSAAMTFDEIVALAHAVEQLLGDVRKQQQPLPLSLGHTLTEATDRLAAMVQARGRGEQSPPVPELVEALSTGRIATVSAPPPSPPPVQPAVRRCRLLPPMICRPWSATDSAAPGCEPSSSTRCSKQPASSSSVSSDCAC